MVEDAAWGDGGGAPDLRGRELLGDEGDDALLGLEGAGVPRKVAVLARTAC